MSMSLTVDRHPCGRVHGCRGMALIAVLWIVAALSVMVLGVTHTVRQQIRVATNEQDQVVGQAVAEAAVALVFQELSVAEERPNEPIAGSISYGGYDMGFELSPLNGLIPLNSADESLLASVLYVAGGLTVPQAQQMAVALVQWRDDIPELDLRTDSSAREARRFEATEDLLLVPGFDYALYERVAPLLTPDLSQGSKVYAAAAPPGVLAVLANGDAAIVSRYLRQRDAGAFAPDSSGLQAHFLGAGRSNFYRIHVTVPLEPGRQLVLQQDIALGWGHSRVAPWRVLATTVSLSTASL